MEKARKAIGYGVVNVLLFGMYFLGTSQPLQLGHIFPSLF